MNVQRKGHAEEDMQFPAQGCKKTFSGGKEESLRLRIFLSMIFPFPFCVLYGFFLLHLSMLLSIPLFNYAIVWFFSL